MSPAKSLPKTGLAKIAQTVANSEFLSKIDRVFPRLGLEAKARYLAGQPLRDGRRYLRLTIPEWKSLLGESFELRCGGQLIYGNLIEAPDSENYPVEYRNIVGTSARVEDYTFTLVSGSQAGQEYPFDLTVRRGPFTTRQQINFDRRFGIKQYGNVFYGLRGNTVNPKKIIFSFPGLGRTTGRVVFPVSALKDVTNQDLSDALMVVFQDRYLTPGSYMLIDYNGDSLISQVTAVIRNFMSKYRVSAGNTLFFGASKGGSIAIYYAEKFPEATLVLSTPQLDLPAYFWKPALRKNLLLEEGFSQIEPAGDKLLRYMQQGRNIHLFYTNDDELSNQSYIEFEQDYARLTKYRSPGKHADVAGMVLPTIAAVIRQFLGVSKQVTSDLAVSDVKVAMPHTNLFSVQLRIQPCPSEKKLNWYLEKQIGRTTQRYLLRQVGDTDLLETTGDGYLMEPVDGLDEDWLLTGVATNGIFFHRPLPELRAAFAVVRRSSSSLAQTRSALASIRVPLCLNTGEVHDYALLNRYRLGICRYRVVSGTVHEGEANRAGFASIGAVQSGAPLTLLWVDQVEDPKWVQLRFPGHNTVVASISGDFYLADPFTRRWLTRTRAPEIAVYNLLSDSQQAKVLDTKLRLLNWDKARYFDHLEHPVC